MPFGITSNFFFSEIEPEEQRAVNASVSVGVNWLLEICIPVAVCSVLLVAVAVFFSKHK